MTTSARTILDATGIPALLRTWPGRFIVAFIAVQMLLPLRYYVHHRDIHDERFAWRMFSPMRMTHCSTHLEIGGSTKDLGNEFHEAWVEIAERGRFSVVEAMGKKLCAKYPKQSVTIELDCQYLDNMRVKWGGYDLCKDPEF